MAHPAPHPGRGALIEAVGASRGGAASPAGTRSGSRLAPAPLVYAGQQITLHYDNLLLKIIAHAEDRPAAIRRLERALYETRLPGLTTNLPFVLRVLRDERFLSGDYDTSIGEDLPAPPLDGKEVVPVVAAALALHRRVPETVVPRARPTRDLPAWVRGDREWTLGR